MKPNTIHHRYKLLQLVLILLFTLHASPSFSQSLSEKLGGIKTDYTFISADSTVIECTDQQIIQRGEFEYDYGTYYDGTYGYGYGYQVYRLEIMTGIKIPVQFRDKSEVRHKFYRVILYNGSGERLATFDLPMNQVKSCSNGDDRMTYSISLQTMPIILLEKAKTIQLIEMQPYLKYR